jgi:hemerythrin
MQNPNPPLHNFFENLKAEHRELVGALGGIRHALETGVVDEAKMDALVTELCGLIETHFMEEERGGYLHDALTRAPRLTSQADALHRQHESLLAEARRLREQVHLVAAHQADWDKFRSQFEAFANGMMTHEAREDDLVQKAVSGRVSVGVDDAL